jgi:parallel beta-helix repeat protein
MKAMPFALALGAVASLALAPAGFAAISCPDRTPAAITAPTGASADCQNAIAKAAAGYVKTQIKADAGCMAKGVPGACPSAKDVAKAQKAAIKGQDAVVKACGAAALLGLTSSYQDVTDATAVASCTMSQNNVEGKLLTLIVNGTPVKVDNDKARAKCAKTVNQAGVKYALGALQLINKCLATNISDGTAGDLSPICVGHWNGGSFVAPTDATVSAKLAALQGKMTAAVEKSCGTLPIFSIQAMGACPGASSAADLENCLACETWDSALDILQAQYSETGTYIANGPGALQAAVDASGPGAKLLIGSGTYNEEVTITKECAGGTNDGAACGSDGDCTGGGTCTSPHQGLHLVGCGGATDDRPFVDVPSTGGPYTNGINGAGVDGLLFQSIAVGDWPENGIFVAGANGVTFRDIFADALDVSKYAVFPIQSNNVLVEGCFVEHVSDAGIYVGQSTNIMVRYNTVFENVAGLEIENSANAEVHNNYANANAGGILVFKLPGLPVQLSNGHNLHHNVSIANNRANIGTGTVGLIPDGTGMIVLSNDSSDFHHNFVSDNGSFGLALIDQKILNTLAVLGGNPEPFPVTSPDQKASDNHVFDNYISPSTNATNPDTTAPNATPLAKPILYVIQEEDGGPGFNGNCFENNVAGAESPVAGNHITLVCP